MTSINYRRVLLQKPEGGFVLANNDKSVWHEFYGHPGVNPRIDVEIQDEGIQIALGKSLELFAPPGIAPTIGGGVSGDLALGVFTMCVNEQEDIAMIEKTARDGNFWYVPGGLVETKDASLWAAGRRELQEETGLELPENTPHKMLFAYESCTRTRHNLMVFCGASCRNSTQLSGAASEGEIAAVAWFQPCDFYALVLAKRIKSLPSVEIALRHLVRWRSIFAQQEALERFQIFKKVYLGERNELLADLCFLKLERTFNESDALDLFQSVIRLTDELSQESYGQK